MKDKFISGVWHIKLDLNGKWVRMSNRQLHNKIESLIQESKADKILIKAQAQIINKL